MFLGGYGVNAVTLQAKQTTVRHGHEDMGLDTLEMVKVAEGL